MKRLKRPKEKGSIYKTARISYISNYVIAVLLIFSLTFLPLVELEANIVQLISLGILFFILILLFEPEAERVLRSYLVTNSEVVKIEGIVVKKKMSIPYQGVADVRTVKGVLGRIFNFGNISVKGLKDDINMKGIKEPEVICRIIENKVSLMKRPGRKRARTEKTEEK